MRVSSEWVDKNDTGHTAAIGVTASITRLMTVTALFHVVTVLILLMASSAPRRVVRDVSVTASARCTRIPVSIGRPPWINCQGGIPDVSCTVSTLVWAVGRTALPSETGISAVAGLWALTGAVREELVFSNTVTFKKTVTGSAGRPACPSGLRKMISSSAYTTISQVYQ
jgi:hypothetical protein